MPSIVETVAGERVRGSWWSHPAGKAIFNVASELADDEDTLVTKLVGAKVTYVHRRFWVAVAKLATDPDRVTAATKRLDADAQKLLREVEGEGTLLLEHHAASWRGDKKRLAKAKEALERGVLVIASQIHTESGAHATVLTSWPAFVDAAGIAHEVEAKARDEARREVSAACGGRDPFGG